MKYLILRVLLAIALFFPAYVLIPVDYAHAASVDCFCVLFLRQVEGVNIHGNSWTIKANEPLNQIEEGDVLLFSYTKTDHVALVVDIIQARYPERPEVYVTIRESNFHHCTPDTRTIPISDPSIRGVFRPSLSTGVSGIAL